MARRWIFAAITMACTTLGGAAFACPTGGATEFAPPPRPRPVQQVSFQAEASQLLERASELSFAASSREHNAVAFDSEADTFANRARALRNQAQLVNVSDRVSVLEIADELSSRAAVSRSRASSERLRASGLRLEARNLRDRATQLVRVNNNGGGWRRNSPSRSVAEGSGINL